MEIATLTDELKKAFTAYKNATAEKIAIRSQLEPLIEEKLLSMNILISNAFIGTRRSQYPKGTIIKEVDDIYLADERDADNFFAECHTIYKEQGFDVELNYSPILIARNKEVEAEHLFIDESMYLLKATGLKREQLNNSLKKRREYLQLTMDLVEKMIKEEEKEK